MPLKHKKRFTYWLKAFLGATLARRTPLVTGLTGIPNSSHFQVESILQPLWNPKSAFHRSFQGVVPMSQAKESESEKESGPTPRIIGNEQPPRPNNCCYWVTKHLLAGEYPADIRGQEATRDKIRRYLDLDVTHFLDLTQKGEKISYQDILQQEATAMKLTEAVSYQRLPVRDFGVPNSARMAAILDAIDGATRENKKVYVHCRGGIGRTGTVVGCYLARHGWKGKDALDEVNRLFQNSDRSYQSYSSPETAEQMNFVKDWNDGNVA